MNLFSQAYRNFSTINDLDGSLFDYDKLFLAFDPLNDDSLNITPSFYEWESCGGNFDFQTATEFNINSYSKDPYVSSGTLMCPYPISNLTARFQISIADMDKNVNNYLEFVFSQNDDMSFNKIVYLFSPSGFIHYYFIVGDQILPQTWPGVNTSINWKLRDHLIVDISINEQGIDFSLNNFHATNNNTSNSNVFGIQYTTYSTSFIVNFDLRDFEAFYAVKSSRNIEDYYDYIENGGDLIIFNSNGYNAFAKEMIEMSFSTSASNKLIGETESIDLLYEIELILLSVTPANASILASYSNSYDEEVPFIITQPIGMGNLYYINIYPIFKAIQLKIYQETGIPYYEDILRVVNLDIPYLTY